MAAAEVRRGRRHKAKKEAAAAEAEAVRRAREFRRTREDHGVGEGVTSPSRCHKEERLSVASSARLSPLTDLLNRLVGNLSFLLPLVPRRLGCRRLRPPSRCSSTPVARSYWLAMDTSSLPSHTATPRRLPAAPSLLLAPRETVQVERPIPLPSPFPSLSPRLPQRAHLCADGLIQHARTGDRPAEPHASSRCQRRRGHRGRTRLQDRAHLHAGPW